MPCDSLRFDEAVRTKPEGEKREGLKVQKDKTVFDILVRNEMQLSLVH
jgi:hypothetical protein